MSDDLPMDENLRGLLLELAEQPERAILSTRVRSFGELLRPDVEVLRPTTGMGIVEAKLLEAYREELAHLLRQASYLRFHEGGRLHLALRDERGQVQTLHREPVVRKTQALAESSSPQSSDRSAEGLLVRAFSHAGTGKRPSPTELAVASLHLAPSSSIRIWLGVYALEGGDPARCSELQRAVIASSPAAIHAAHAWANVSVAANVARRYEDSLQAGRAAALAEPGAGRGPLSWLCAAIQAGRIAEVRSASSALADVLHEGSHELAEQIDVISESKARGLWSPTPQSFVVTGSASLALPSAAERILEVFQ